MGMRTTWFAVPGGILGIASFLMLLWSPTVRAAAVDPPGSLIAPRSVCRAQETVRVPGRVLKQSVECLANYARQRSGLVPLARDYRLDEAARRRTGDLVRCGVYPPHEPCGVWFGFRMEQAGYGPGCRPRGEDIGWSTVRTKYDTVRSIFRAWMNSVTHRENILHGEYRTLGIGFRIGDVLGYRSRLWVLYFGGPCPPDPT